MQHRFNKLATSSPAEFDYVIIGAGSAVRLSPIGWARIRTYLSLLLNMAAVMQGLFSCPLANSPALKPALLFL
jgi:hypothetical protein